MFKSNPERPWSLRYLAVATALATAALAQPVLSRSAQHGAHPHKSDHILIADQFNNRIIEIDRATHAIVWQFGDGFDTPSASSIVGPNDAERFGELTLISGTGIPPSSPPLPGCSDPVNGCPDNRVLIVNHGGHIVWQYGEGGVAGSDADQLNTPVDAIVAPGFLGKEGLVVMITDQANQRVIAVDRKKQIIWQYGTTGISGNGPDQLNNPNSQQFLDNGNVLIADENNNRVIEVKTDGTLVAQFTAGGTISGAAFASRLPGGDTLITDSNNSRIVEVDANDAVVWQYMTNTDAGSNASPLPTRAVRLRNGDTLISDQFNQRVIEVTPAGQIVFTQGELNTPGDGFDRLNGPYDAKDINDFTGLTAPKNLGEGEQGISDDD
ncbi:MAG TPA: hypothetical protein VN599_01875 [Rudaea sp.]|nr:hypothetical protein [Rudaea sp.]